MLYASASRQSFDVKVDARGGAYIHERRGGPLFFVSGAETREVVPASENVDRFDLGESEVTYTRNNEEVFFAVDLDGRNRRAGGVAPGLQQERARFDAIRVTPGRTFTAWSPHTTTDPTHVDVTEPSGGLGLTGRRIGDLITTSVSLRLWKAGTGVVLQDGDRLFRFSGGAAIPLFENAHPIVSGEIADALLVRVGDQGTFAVGESGPVQRIEIDAGPTAPSPSGLVTIDEGQGRVARRGGKIVGRGLTACDEILRVVAHPDGDRVYCTGQVGDVQQLVRYALDK